MSTTKETKRDIKEKKVLQYTAEEMKTSKIMDDERMMEWFYPVSKVNDSPSYDLSVKISKSKKMNGRKY